MAFHSLDLESHPPHTNFSQALRQSLIARGIDVHTPAPITLKILSQDFTRTLTSLGSAGQTTTYLLSYSVLFQLLDDTNHPLLPRQEVRATRHFSITSNQLGGDLNTQSHLENAMQEDIIQQIATRLAAPALHQRLCQPCPFGR